MEPTPLRKDNEYILDTISDSDRKQIEYEQLAREFEAKKLRDTYQQIGGEAINSSWRSSALCRNEDPELFFPTGTTGPAVAQIADAKLVCGRCPVAADCLEHAQAADEKFGIWGGMTPDEREALKRKKSRAARQERLR